MLAAFRGDSPRLLRVGLVVDTATLIAVAEASIKAGRLPEGVELPALLVRGVSLVDRQPLKRGAMTRSVERVAVTVRASNYRDVGLILKIVRKALAGWTGSIAGAERISILTAGTGPDVNGPGNTFERTQDFRVSFDAAT